MSGLVVAEWDYGDPYCDEGNVFKCQQVLGDLLFVV
jgi:hypothetical protein